MFMRKSNIRGSFNRDILKLNNERFHITAESKLNQQKSLDS